MFCPECGSKINLSNNSMRFCRNCGTDINELRSRTKVSKSSSKGRKILYDNPEKMEKKCGKCGEIKPYSEFKRRSDNTLKRRSSCKKCDSLAEAERLQMKSWVSKIEAIKLVTNYRNKCQICEDVGIENLPMFDFHHLDPSLSTKDTKKKGFWRTVRYKNWEYIRKEIIKQKVSVICRNCHAKINATFFKLYKDFIVNCNNPRLITHNLIHEQYIRNEVKTFIRKKLVLLDLWDGSCTICGHGITEYNVENLPCLEIHHTKPELKNFNSFHRLCYLNSNLKKLKKILIDEECVCLCSNCHIMVQSRFFNSHKIEIFLKHKEKFRN